jgi:hypothetical protein
MALVSSSPSSLRGSQPSTSSIFFDTYSRGAHARQTLVLSGSFRLTRFLFIISPHAKPVNSVGEWTSVLKLATMWGFAKSRHKAIAALSNLIPDPIPRIALARAHDIPGWELAALRTLITRTPSLTEGDVTALGISWVLKIASLRERHGPHASGHDVTMFASPYPQAYQPGMGAKLSDRTIMDTFGVGPASDSPPMPTIENTTEFFRSAHRGRGRGGF